MSSYFFIFNHPHYYFPVPSKTSFYQIMAISTEGIIGIIAIVVASIPIGLGTLKYWKLRSRQQQSNESLQGYILPRWNTTTPGQGQPHTPTFPTPLIREIYVVMFNLARVSFLMGQAASA
ncbi:hypothetical protein BJX99DRAFT_223215 [Aspergillus californicus]